MDGSTVYTKTAKGVKEISAKTLKPEAYKILKWVDGKSKVDLLLSGVDMPRKDFEKYMQALERDGFVRVFEVRSLEPAGGMLEDDDELDFTAIGGGASASTANDDELLRAARERAQAQSRAREQVESNTRRDQQQSVQALRDAHLQAGRVREEAVVQAERLKAQVEAAAFEQAELAMRLRADAEERAQQELENAQKLRAEVQAKAKQELEKAAVIKAQLEAKARASADEAERLRKKAQEDLDKVSRLRADLEAKAAESARQGVALDQAAQEKMRGELAKAEQIRKDAETQAAAEAQRASVLKSEVEAELKSERERIAVMRTEAEAAAKAEAERARQMSENAANLKADMESKALLSERESARIRKQAELELAQIGQMKAELEAQRIAANAAGGKNADLEAKLAKEMARIEAIRQDAEEKARLETENALSIKAEIEKEIAAERERLTRLKSESEALAHSEAVRLKELNAEVAKLREEADARASAEAQRAAMVTARVQQDADEALRRAEQLRVEAETRAKIEIAEAMRLRDEAQNIAREQSVKLDEARRQAEAETRALEEARRRTEEEAKALELARSQAVEEAKRSAQEVAAEKEALAREQAEITRKTHAAAQLAAEDAKRGAEEQLAIERKELQGRLDEERKAREEIASKAKSEAESLRQAQHSALERLEAEKQAREQAELRAKVESRARQAVEVETRAKVEAEINARHAQNKDEREGAEYDRNLRLLKEAREHADRDEEVRMRQEQDERAREMAANLKAKDVAAKAKEPEKAAKAARRKGRAGGMGMWAYVSMGLVALGLGGVFGLPHVPLSGAAQGVANVATAKLGVPVKVTGASINLIPKPHLALQGISIGDKALTAGTGKANTDLASLFSDAPNIKTLELQGAAISAEGLKPMLALLLGQSARSASSGGVQKVIMKEARIAGIGTMDFDMSLGVNGQIGQAVATFNEGKGSFTLVPAEGGPKVTMSTKESTIPGIPLTFAVFDGVGVANADGITFSELNGTLANGGFKGTGKLTWIGGVKLLADLKIENAKVDSLLAGKQETIKINGRVGGNFQVTADATDLNGLSSNSKIAGSFTVSDGALANIDFLSAIRNPDVNVRLGGNTKFEEITGNITNSTAGTVLRNVKLKSSGMAASSSLDVDKDGAMSGRIDAQIISAVVRDSGGFVVSGKSKSPQLKRTN